MKNKKVKIAVRVLAAVLAAGVVVGAVFGVRAMRGGNSAVAVYQLVNMTYTSDDMGGGSEMSGSVSADQVQTVYISDTQTVTEVYVSEGQEVKVGDPLISYDTTLTDIELTRKDLDIQKQKIELENLQKQVKTGRRLSAVPDIITASEDDPSDTGDGDNTGDTGNIGDSGNTGDTGNAGDSGNTGDTGNAGDSGNTGDTGNAGDSGNTGDTGNTGDSGNAGDTGNAGDSGNTGDSGNAGDTGNTGDNGNTGDSGNAGNTGNTGDGGNTGNSGDPVTSEITDPVPPAEVPDDTGSSVTKGVVDNYYVVQGEGTEKDPKFVILAEDFEISDTLLKKLDLHTGKNYLIFVNTEENKVKGAILTKNGLVCTVKEDDSYSFSFFDASSFTYEKTSDEPSVIDPGSMDGGYIGSDDKLTAAEIAEMKMQIKTKDLEIRVAENELAQMKKEIDNGQVVATVSGRVATVQDADTARADGTPMIKVTGTGGYKIQCSIGELDRDSLQIGEEVQVMSYETGGMYSGTVSEIGDMPITNNGYYYGQSSNTSYYPFTVSVSEDADMFDNEYVSVRRNSSSASGGGGFYLENMFILTEGGKSYVYVRGEGDKLEKREVRTGTISYGSTEILSGLDRETDWVAFPYGKTIKDGAATREATMDELYS